MMMSTWNMQLIRLVLAAALLGGLQACSGFPRLVVLHDPLTPEEHVSLGTSYLQQGLTEKAEEEFRTALAREPRNIQALVSLGNLSFERGKLEEAEEFYRRVLDEMPGHPGASNNLAMVYVARGDRLDEAERMALMALQQAGPLRPYCLDTLAHVYLRQKRFQEATAALDEAEALAATAGSQGLLDRLHESRHILSIAIVHGRQEASVCAFMDDKGRTCR
jgi:tetratricopeptide (TPR) repeat protein